MLFLHAVHLPDVIVSELVKLVVIIYFFVEKFPLFLLNACLQAATQHVLVSLRQHFRPFHKLLVEFSVKIDKIAMKVILVGFLPFQGLRRFRILSPLRRRLLLLFCGLLLEPITNFLKVYAAEL